MKERWPTTQLQAGAQGLAAPKQNNLAKRRIFPFLATLGSITLRTDKKPGFAPQKEPISEFSKRSGFNPHELTKIFLNSSTKGYGPKLNLLA